MTVAAKYYNNTMSGTLVNQSVTNVTTASQALLSENKDRRYLLIQNISDVNIGVHMTGGTASIGGSGTVTLLPYGSIEYSTSYVPQNAITVIAASGSSKAVLCLEG